MILKPKCLNIPLAVEEHNFLKQKKKRLEKKLNLKKGPLSWREFFIHSFGYVDLKKHINKKDDTPIIQPVQQQKSFILKIKEYFKKK